MCRGSGRFDYAAEGWQGSRIPEIVGLAGSLDFAKVMYWDYLPDGLQRALLDQGGERALYAYDQNGNRTLATEATGIVDPCNRGQVQFVAVLACGTGPGLPWFPRAGQRWV